MKDGFREWLSDNLRYILLILGVIIGVLLISFAVKLAGRITSGNDKKAGQGANGSGNVAASADQSEPDDAGNAQGVAAIEILTGETEPAKETEKPTETEPAKETEKSTETEPAKETEKPTETEKETEKATERITETEPVKAAEQATETEPETEKKTEQATETEPETEKKTEQATETEPETEKKTEQATETEPVTEKAEKITVAGALRETQKAAETERATQKATEKVTETESEKKTEKTTKTERPKETEKTTETEKATETEALTEFDIVVTRKQPETAVESTPAATASAGPETEVKTEPETEVKTEPETQFDIVVSGHRPETEPPTEKETEEIDTLVRSKIRKYFAQTSLNIRSGPGTDFEVLGSSDTGREFSVTGETTSWYQVVYNGRAGYVSKELLGETYTPDYRVMKSTCYLRSEAGYGDNIIAEIYGGTTVEYVFNDGGWAYIRVDGMEGYIGAKFLPGTGY